MVTGVTTEPRKSASNCSFILPLFKQRQWNEIVDYMLESVYAAEAEHGLSSLPKVPSQ